MSSATGNRAATAEPSETRPRGQRPVSPEQGETLRQAHELEIDADRLRSTVEHLAALGSCALGYRAAGTPEDREAAELITDEMSASGLEDVGIEEVAVDGWRLLDARIELVGGASYEASSFGGVTPTAPDGVEAQLVDVGGARRTELDRSSLRGRIPLLDWRPGRVRPIDIALEVGLRGAVGLVISCPEGSTLYQEPGALGAFNSEWAASAPPMVYLRREDMADLRAAVRAGHVNARMVLHADLTRDATGCNAVGYLAGPRTKPVVVSAHHDGWFRGAFDNASGVAAMLGVARALKRGSSELRHAVCFTSTTGEEYGLYDTEYDWGVGAWRQAAETHPGWARGAPFHLCIDASGHPALPLQMNTPRELTRWARAMCRVAEGEGWLDQGGWRVTPPVTGTDQWPLLLRGIPGVAAYNWGKPFRTTSYHTQHDTPATVDFGRLERLTRFYSWLVLEADRDPESILDHRARSRSLTRSISGLGAEADDLRRAVANHGHGAGRDRFTRVGQGLLAVTARGSIGYPHEQAAHDAEHLSEALAAVRVGDQRRAARELMKVGDNELFPYMSRQSLAARRRRRMPRHVKAASWGRASHLTTSPNLWPELAALRGERRARKVGPWLERSLERELERSRGEVRRRTQAMTRVLS